MAIYFWNLDCNIFGLSMYSSETMDQGFHWARPGHQGQRRTPAITRAFGVRDTRYLMVRGVSEHSRLVGTSRFLPVTKSSVIVLPGKFLWVFIAKNPPLQPVFQKDSWSKFSLFRSQPPAPPCWRPHHFQPDNNGGQRPPHSVFAIQWCDWGHPPSRTRPSAHNPQKNNQCSNKNIASCIVEINMTASISSQLVLDFYFCFFL